MTDDIDETYARLTDRTNVMALDGSEYSEDRTEFVSRLNVSYLKDVLEIVDTLGWEHVDVYGIGPLTDDGPEQLLAIVPEKNDGPWAEGQAAVTIAPRKVDDD